MKRHILLTFVLLGLVFPVGGFAAGKAPKAPSLDREQEAKVEALEKEMEASHNKGPVTKAKEKTQKAIEKGANATEKVVLDPVEDLKERANEMLPSEMELVSSEESNNDRDVGPQIKLKF